MTYLLMRQPDKKISVYSLLIVICLLLPPTWKKIVPPTFPNVGGTKFFSAGFARESSFVPLTFKIVAPPLDIIYIDQMLFSKEQHTVITGSLAYEMRRLKSFLFCKSSLPQPCLFLLHDSLYGFPRVFTVTSEHVRLFTF